MAQAGGLAVRIAHDGGRVSAVEVASNRPPAYRLLRGRLPEAAVQLAPMLYSVCGRAQRAAASAAVAAARGDDAAQCAELERSVLCETLQEHLWRLLLDWPKQLGLAQQQQVFVHWHGKLNAIASGQDDASTLRAELLRQLLGITTAEWQALDSYAALCAWLGRGRGLLAPVVEALVQQEEMLEFETALPQCSLMPRWNAEDVWQQHAAQLNAEFAAAPQCGGEPLETGPLAYWQHAPLLQDVLHRHPTRLLARLLARLVDLLDGAAALAHGEIGGRVQGVAAGNAAGLALVQTARGMLLHYTRIETERVAEYLAVAPTEWNFHPRGALTGGLAGLKETDAHRLQQTVRNFVLSLDPCVEYRIEVQHA